MVETKIAGFSLDGMAPANVFGESTSFSVSLTEGNDFPTNNMIKIVIM